MNKTYLEPEEITIIEQSAEYLRDRLLIRLLFRLGCRVSEALGITIGDINFALGTVTIQHLKVRIKRSCPACGQNLSKAASFCPGCGQEVQRAVEKQREHRRQRTLPVDGETLQLLQEYIDGGGPDLVKGKRYIFGITRRRAWGIVRSCAEKAGFPYLVNPETGELRGVSPHRLRDAFAVNAVKSDDSGDGIRMLQEHLGHQSITTTMRYRKVSGTEQKQWYEKLWGKEGKDGAG